MIPSFERLPVFPGILPDGKLSAKSQVLRTCQIRDTGKTGLPGNPCRICKICNDGSTVRPWRPSGRRVAVSGHELMAFLNVRGASLQTHASRTARSKESDPNRGFGHALLARDLFGRDSAHLLLQENPVAWPADLQNPGDINRRQVDTRLSTKFRERLVCGLASKDAAVDIQRDAVHPGPDEAVISKLAQAFPSASPGGLSHLPCPVTLGASRAQQPDRQLKSSLVRLSVFVSGHVSFFLRTTATRSAFGGPDWI
jgi:hypothetical protein